LLTNESHYLPLAAAYVRGELHEPSLDEDDNPEHVHLSDGHRLSELFLAAGARRVTIQHVLNHIVAVALR
jgi:hypothetical protein